LLRIYPIFAGGGGGSMLLTLSPTTSCVAVRATLATTCYKQTLIHLALWMLRGHSRAEW